MEDILSNPTNMMKLEKRNSSFRFFRTKKKKQLYNRGGFEGEGGVARGALVHVFFFCNDLQFFLFFFFFVFFAITLKNNRLLFEDELIINNAPLTYVYPNTIYVILFNNQSFAIWLAVIIFF